MKLSSHIPSLTLLLALLCTACGDNVPIIETESQKNPLKENMINANRMIIQSEQTQIDGYIQRHGWTMQALPSGARYSIARDGNGTPVHNGDTVAVTYCLETLDGSQLYSNQTDTLVVGRLQATQALDNLLTLMHRSDNTVEAVLIAPSNSAYGVVGDGDRVPPRTVIVYKLKSIKSI